MVFKIGDRIKIYLEKETLGGVYIPSPDKNLMTLKLDSGYNLNMNKKDIKKIKLIERVKIKENKGKEKIKLNPKLPSISILHTGGTIASSVSYRTGAVEVNFTLEHILRLVPELKNLANIKSRLIRNMWSDDLRFKHFSLIAREIVKEIKSGANGVIIAIGTDNLAVASAALSFILDKLPIPILLVGAQRSSDRGSTDAAVNLIAAAKFIINSDFSGVGICMHSEISDDVCNILPACKTKKLHTSRRDAFKVVNGKVIARINYKTGDIEYFDKSYHKKGQRNIIIKDKMEEKVGLIRITVNMFAKQFESFKGFKGLIIEGTGLGHTPLDVIDDFTKEHTKIKKALAQLSKNGCIVVMCSHCLFGKVNMNVYSKGKDLQEMGIIPGEDMLADTALVKLSWLLGNYKKDEVKKLIKENLRGEINNRIEVGYEI